MASQNREHERFPLEVLFVIRQRTLNDRNGVRPTERIVDMDINHIIKIADQAYDHDGILIGQWDDRNRKPRKTALHGMSDTLARFIVMEITETFDPSLPDREQLDCAAHVIARAADQCMAVAEALGAIPVTAAAAPPVKSDRNEKTRERRQFARERLQLIVNNMMESEG